MYNNVYKMKGYFPTQSLLILGPIFLIASEFIVSKFSKPGGSKGAKLRSLSSSGSSSPSSSSSSSPSSSTTAYLSTNNNNRNMYRSTWLEKYLDESTTSGK
ncbi:unnamed protein product [Candida verbasci]|uniref:Uncharacterized protein n=1 Tax=Candida verbasci TaxID=1227364 RepID=A0A9W4X964_9ASCO|nr:unnamed protein product [Candida verbasci]